MEITTGQDFFNTVTNISSLNDLIPIVKGVFIVWLGVLLVSPILYAILEACYSLIKSNCHTMPVDSNHAICMYICVRKKRKKLFKTKEILVDEVKYLSLELLTIETREQILSRIQPKFDVIRTLAEESKRVKAEYALMTPYMELLYKDLSQAIGQTEHDYEEGQLLNNLTYTEQALNKIIEKLKTEKKWDDEEQEIKQTIIKESELQAHMDDMAATKALTDML